MAATVKLDKVDGMGCFLLNDNNLPKGVVSVEYFDDIKLKMTNAFTGQTVLQLTAIADIELDGSPATTMGEVKDWVGANCYSPDAIIA